MKLKLASLGLLALVPMAAQAELVEMQDAEMADVNGQGFSWGGSLDADWSGSVAGYDVTQSFSAYKSQYYPAWSVSGTKGVSSPSSGRWYEKSLEVGAYYGTKYIAPSFSWGRFSVNS